MAGPASTVAFVIARSPARGLEGTGRTRRPARGGRLLGAPTPWRDRNTSGTLPRRRSRRRRFAGSWDPASVTSTRRATSTWVPTATGPESAGPAPPAPRSSFKNSGEVTTSTTASQYRRATQGPDGGSHAHGPTIGAADQDKLPRIQLTAGDHGPLEHPEQHWPWQPVSQPPADHVPTAASNAAQSTTTGSRRWPARHDRAASAAVPPPHWPGYAVKHDLLGGTENRNT